MVVRVISDKPVKTQKVICSNCGYELEYTGEDIHTYTRREIDGGCDTYHTITCPRQTCNHKIFVKQFTLG